MVKHEFHETCDSVTSYFRKKTLFQILSGRLEFFHEIKCNGITSCKLLGVLDNLYSKQNLLEVLPDKLNRSQTGQTAREEERG